MRSALTWHRLWAIVLKEFVQMRRDRITFAMMVGIPVIQLVLFGFAINTDPKRLPAVDDVDGAWGLYLRTWRPGKPKPDTWPGFHTQARVEVTA